MENWSNLQLYAMMLQKTKLELLKFHLSQTKNRKKERKEYKPSALI